MVEVHRQDPLLEVLRGAVARVVPNAHPSLIDEDSVIADLGLTSMEILEVIAELEDVLGVLLPEEMLSGEIKTVGDLFVLVARTASAKVDEPRLEGGASVISELGG